MMSSTCLSHNPLSCTYN